MCENYLESPSNYKEGETMFQFETIVVNVSGTNAIISLKNILPTDIGSGQGLEIIL